MMIFFIELVHPNYVGSLETTIFEVLANQCIIQQVLLYRLGCCIYRGPRISLLAWKIAALHTSSCFGLLPGRDISHRPLES